MRIFVVFFVAFFRAGDAELDLWVSVATGVDSADCGQVTHPTPYLMLVTQSGSRNVFFSMLQFLCYFPSSIIPN